MINNRISIITTFKPEILDKLTAVAKTSKKLRRTRIIEIAVEEWMERNKDIYPNILMNAEEKARIDAQIARDEMK